VNARFPLRPARGVRIISGMVRAIPFALLAFACSAEPGSVPISAEPVPSCNNCQVFQDAGQVPIPAPRPPPKLKEAPPERDAQLLLSPPPAPAAPPPEPDPNAPPPGYHLSNGACYLPNVLKVGECRCTEYDAAHVIVKVGEQCADSCSLNADGVTVFHTFCVPGGLTADRTLR
jgi:hypothetical protein